MKVTVSLLILLVISFALTIFNHELLNYGLDKGEGEESLFAVAKELINKDVLQSDRILENDSRYGELAAKINECKDTVEVQKTCDYILEQIESYCVVVSTNDECVCIGERVVENRGRVLGSVIGCMPTELVTTNICLRLAAHIGSIQCIDCPEELANSTSFEIYYNGPTSEKREEIRKRNLERERQRRIQGANYGIRKYRNMMMMSCACLVRKLNMNEECPDFIALTNAIVAISRANSAEAAIFARFIK